VYGNLCAWKWTSAVVLLILYWNWPMISPSIGHLDRERGGKNVRIYTQLQSLHLVHWNSVQNCSTEIASLYWLMEIKSHTLLHLSPIVLILRCTRLSNIHKFVTSLNMDKDMHVICWYVYLCHKFLSNPTDEICLWEVLSFVKKNTAVLCIYVCTLLEGFKQSFLYCI
jgi:hypothetical protein